MVVAAVAVLEQRMEPVVLASMAAAMAVSMTVT
jgi:hypothetical protein